MIQQTLWQEHVGGIIPRDYQVEDVANSFRLWDSGEIGVLTRAATGMGKTIMSCLKFRRWLDSGPDYHCMVLSYERELVQQFAEEVRDVLGNVSIGIEMGDMSIDPNNVPQIVVASRQTLMTHELATMEQRAVLKELGLSDVKLLTKSDAKRAIRDLRNGVDLQAVADAVDEFNASDRCNHELGRVSRLYKFDNKLNWLLVMDEAHKYSMQLKTVGHIIEWFEKNPLHRRSGITATPKRRDKVSIGTKLFPGISIDYPLTRAVAEGYAVPYVQKFVQVESVDFKAIKEIAGKSQEKWDNEVNRRIEQDLAKLCDPLLDMVGDRSTLIFSPSVDLAAKVCDYINARSECECQSCGTRTWHPKVRIGDGAKCPKCSDWLESKHVTKDGIQAHSLHGAVPHRERTQVYANHKAGRFQFLSVCGLCREGYNDRNISCVAVFRPVSKDASSLAEQMKGRGARPAKGTIDGLDTAAERLAAIAASEKPNCLIVDLVGITGLADCASTIQIYADGLDDAIVARAEEIALEGGVEDPQEAIKQAQREDAEAKEKKRLAALAAEEKRRQQAEERARLDAKANYTTHDVGTSTRDPSQASDKMLKFLYFLGMEFTGNWEPSRAQASRMIGLLQKGESPEQVAYLTGLAEEDWQKAKPSINQLRKMRSLGHSPAPGMTPKEASDVIDALVKGKPAPRGYMREIHSAKTHDELTAIAKSMQQAMKSGSMNKETFAQLVEAGRKRREQLQ